MLPSSPDGAAGAGAGAGLWRGFWRRCCSRRRCRCRRWRCRSAASARHPLDVTHHVVERRVVREQEVLVHWEREARSDVGHDLGLLDRVNAKFTLEVLVHFDEVSRVAGVLHDDRHHGVHEVTCIGRGNGSGWCWGWGRCRSRRRCSLDRCRKSRLWSRSRMVHGCFGCWSRSAALHARQVRQHVVERRMVGEHEVLVHGQREPVPKRRHDFGLLDRVNAQLAFQILIHFDELCRVACVFDDHFNHGSSDLFVAGVHGDRCCRSGGGCGLGSRLRCRLREQAGLQVLRPCLRRERLDPMPHLARRRGGCFPRRHTRPRCCS